MNTLDNNKRRFFFEYIYYRITQLFFKRDGRTGFTGIAFISIVQALFIGAMLLELSKQFFTEDARAAYARQFGYLGSVIGLGLMYYNFKKYNGKYNQYRFHWKDESRHTRLLKGIYILLIFILPIALITFLGVHWKQR